MEITAKIFSMIVIHWEEAEDALLDETREDGSNPSEINCTSNPICVSHVVTLKVIEIPFSVDHRDMRRIIASLDPNVPTNSIMTSESSDRGEDDMKFNCHASYNARVWLDVFEKATGML